jgi:hypothetical protein
MKRGLFVDLSSPQIDAWADLYVPCRRAEIRPVERCGVPHLAKNERDMGPPVDLWRENKKHAEFVSSQKAACAAAGGAAQQD